MSYNKYLPVHDADDDFQENSYLLLFAVCFTVKAIQDCTMTISQA